MRSGAVPGSEIRRDKESFYYDCWLAIYEESSMGSDVPSYQLSAMQGPFEELGGVSKLLAFHPNNSILATVLDGKTYLWKFTGTTPPSISLTIDYQSTMSQMVEIYGHPLDNITFSPCGRYLWGNRDSGETIPIILPVDKIIPRTTVLWRNNRMLCHSVKHHLDVKLPPSSLECPFRNTHPHTHQTASSSRPRRTAASKSQL